MKIAFFTVFFLEQGGGLAKYFIETASNLAQTPPIKTDVITMDDRFNINIMKLTHVFYMSFVSKMDMRLIYNENIDSIRKNLGDASYFKVNSIKDLRKKLQEYDLIYSKNEVLEAFILKFLVGYKNLPPVVFGCHTPFYYPQAISLQSKLHNFLYNSFVYRFLTSGVKAFHVTNTFDEKNLQKLLPGKRIIKIYNPLNISALAEQSDKHVYKFKWDKSKLNILWVARLTEQKGIPELLEIIDSLNSNGYLDKVIFNIVGDGDRKLRKDILDHKIKWRNINYLGSVEYSYMPSIYKVNNLFISTSKWESFGLSVLEAQAFGLPAISFDIPGSQDIINEKTGFLVKDNQEYVKQIKEIVDKRFIFDKAFIASNVKKRFDPEVIYPKLIGLFKQVSVDMKH